MSERDDDFLGRWSRRKAEARDGGLRKKEAVAELPVHKPGRMRTDPLPPKDDTADVLEGETGDDPNALREASLSEDQIEEQPPAPLADDAAAEDREHIDKDDDPESFEEFDFDGLDYDSDYTRFMKDGVPESVRKRALRKLWGSNPILANIDGLNDYDDDFTDAALAVKGLLKTSYKAATGYLTDEERIASYSEEARKAGAEPVDEEADTDDGDAQGEPEDGERGIDEQPSDEDARTASADDEASDTDSGDRPGTGSGKTDDTA